MPKVTLTEEQRKDYGKVIANIKNTDPQNHIVGYYLDELEKYPTTALRRLTEWVDKKDEDRLRKTTRGHGQRAATSDLTHKRERLQGDGDDKVERH